MTDPNDDLAPLLGAPPEPADESPALREAILRRTGRVVTMRRWVRRAKTAAAVLAVFAGGAVAGALVTGARQPPAPRAPLDPVAPEVVVVPVVVPVVIGAPAPSPAPVETPTAARLELDAEQADDPGAAAKLYRRAGDTYLAREQDYANATRCYRLYLTRAGDPALSPEQDDSWLLASLKLSAFKEKNHAATVHD